MRPDRLLEEVQAVARAVSVDGWLRQLNLRCEARLRGNDAARKLVLRVTFNVPDTFSGTPQDLTVEHDLAAFSFLESAAATTYIMLPRSDGAPRPVPLSDDAQERRQQLADAVRGAMLMVLRHELDEALVIDGRKPWWPGHEHDRTAQTPDNVGWGT